jgi:arabinose-5-phosphate isomerase
MKLQTDFLEVLKIEGTALLTAAERLKGARLEPILALLLERSESGGKVFCIGIGKSGKIAQKIAATLSSTGTPSFFVHATEALHGDLGGVTPDDTVLALSFSGNTEEVIRLLPFFASKTVPVIGIGGNAQSALAKGCTHWIDASVETEACPLNLAPTSSTTLALAIGDAIAVSLMKARGTSIEDFARNHPSGSLGRRLSLTVSDVMKTEALPIVPETANMAHVVEASTLAKLGAVLVSQDGKKLHGLITDGDIRRALKLGPAFFQLTASECMTKTPTTVLSGQLAVEALQLMENRPSQLSVLPVVDNESNIVGILRIHDLVQSL